eukprot:scaffold2297_cov153-Ochromonas_danica.AAC.2
MVAWRPFRVVLNFRSFNREGFLLKLVCTNNSSSSAQVREVPPEWLVLLRGREEDHQPCSGTRMLMACCEAPKTTTKAKAASAAKKTKAPTVANPLFASKPRSFRIGGSLRRLKVPPALNQFNRTLDKNEAAELFKLLVKYQPENKAAKTQRLEAVAAAAAAKEAAPATVPPLQVKYGIKHVTSLIEKKKAKLVVIAHDVDPIELVVWLPALCRKMDVPFCIVKGKSRLGTLTHLKTCSALALTKVNKEDEAKLKQLTESFHAQFNEHAEKKWGGGIMGLKTQAKLEKRRKQIEEERLKKLEAQR